MAEIVIFAVLSVVILGAALLCVTTTRIMRAATFMLFVLFGVAGIYFLLDAIQLVNKKTLQGIVEKINVKRAVGGILVALLGLVTVLAVMLKNAFIVSTCSAEDGEVPMKLIGQALLGSDKYQYVLPFEFISVFLLACIIGGIVIARKEENK